MAQFMYYSGLIFFSIVVGLTGIFYRNILKMPNMIFSPLYKVFEKMVSKGGFIAWIAYPLGYCIYCSTTWIAILGYIVVYRRISLDIMVPVSISHYFALYFVKHYADLPAFNKNKNDRTLSNVTYSVEEIDAYEQWQRAAEMELSVSELEEFEDNLIKMK